MTTKSWVQDPVTGKLIPKHLYVPQSENRVPYIQGDIEPFVSPITKEVISDRGKLRNHMREHGVTHSDDYSKEFLHKRRLAREAEMTGQTSAAKQERREIIERELHRRGI